jgi:hypothetical protein
MVYYGIPLHGHYFAIFSTAMLQNIQGLILSGVSGPLLRSYSFHDSIIIRCIRVPLS